MKPGRMRKAALWSALALLVVLINFPAHWLLGPIDKATGGRLRVLHSSGTLWKGQAQLGVSDGGRVYALPDPLQWRWVFAESDVRLGLQFSHVRMDSPLNLGWGAQGLGVGSGNLRLPAAWLMAVGAPFNTLKPEGVLNVTWGAVTLSNPELNIQVVWKDAQSALSPIRPLGEYQVQVRGNPQRNLSLSLSTVSGPLQLQGQGDMTGGNRLNFTGEAWTDDTHRAALTGLLSQMGRLRGDRYVLGVL